MAKFNPLLTFKNAKTIKGQPLGYLTAILYLAPEKTAGLKNVCPSATPGCVASCLFTAGRGAMGTVMRGRIRKTVEYLTHREKFYSDLDANILRAEKRANREGLKLAIRLNGTSDQPQLALHFARKYPHITFYDYTKVKNVWTRVLPNYSLTFSYSETNEAEARFALAQDINVAVVFDTKKGEKLPSFFLGRPVIDGDEHDLRFLDPQIGVVVGLRAKGKAKYDDTGFVVRLSGRPIPTRKAGKGFKPTAQKLAEVRRLAA